MPIRILLLVRHGNYRTANPFGEEPDGPLTEEGIEQATLVAGRVVQAPAESGIHFDIHQCGITEIEVRPSGWIKLVYHNETGQLPSRLRSFV